MWAVAQSYASPLSTVSCDEPIDSAGVLREAVVVAMQADKAVVSTAPMQIYDEKLLGLAGVADVSDAVHRLPGVTLRDYGGAGGLKTVSVRGFGSGHTGVVYDGIPLSDAQSGQIDIARYSIDNVGSLSMVVGDNDDIFTTARAAAAAASLFISSADVGSSTELKAQLRAGSFGFINPFLRVGGAVSQKLRMNVVGEYTHCDNNYPFTLQNGNIVTTEHRNNSKMDAGHCEVNAVWRMAKAATLTAKVYGYSADRYLPGPVIYYNNVSNERLRERNLFAQAEYRHVLSSNLTMKWLGKFNYASSFYHDENGKYPGGVLDQNYWQREYYVAGALLWEPISKLALDYSADYFFNNLNSNLISDTKPRRHSILQSATAKFHTRGITLTGRLLYSIYDNGAETGEAASDASRLSPSASISVQPWARQQFFIRASYKHIFRMPTFNEAYFDHYGSRNLLPETTEQFNIGATFSPRGNAWLGQTTFTVDGYMNNIRDMIVAVPYNMFIWNMTNLGKVKVFGVDATAKTTFNINSKHSLLLIANYSFQRAMPRTNRESNEWNKQVAYIPQHSGSVSVSYTGPWVCCAVHGTGVSERFTTNNNLPATRISGYMEWGARLWRTFPINRHSLEARLDVQNIFNKQYEVVARYPMPGRAWQATVLFNY